MGDTSVPLWAFLLTGLAAVVGPFLTAWLTNGNAARLAKEQDEHALLMLKEANRQERQTWLDDHRLEAYQEALGTMRALDAQRDLWKSGVDTMEKNFRAMESAITNTIIFGSEEAKNSAHQVAGSFMNMHEDVEEFDKDARLRLVAEFGQAINKFALVVRQDMQGTVRR